MFKAENLEDTLKEFGGVLRCQTCNHEEPINNISKQLTNGWKKCCGYTMRWVTARELKDES